MPTPLKRYERDLKLPGFARDEAQANAVAELQNLYDRLTASVKGGGGAPLLGKLFGGKKKKVQPEKGLYFWGGVGRGKTYLMDNFYESLPFENKMRAHFHRFMRRVHEDLKKIKRSEKPP